MATAMHGQQKTIAGFTWRETVDHGAWAKVRRVVRLCENCASLQRGNAAPGPSGHETAGSESDCNERRFGTALQQFEAPSRGNPGQLLETDERQCDAPACTRNAGSGGDPRQSCSSMCPESHSAQSHTDSRAANASTFSEAERAFGREVYNVMRSQDNESSRNLTTDTESTHCGCAISCSEQRATCENTNASLSASPTSCTCESFAVKIFYRGHLARKIRNGIELLRAEYALVRSLSHERIVRYLLLDEESRPHKIYLFMEYCPGGPITSLAVDVDSSAWLEESSAGSTIVPELGAQSPTPAKQPWSPEQKDTRHGLAQNLEAIRDAMRGLLEGLAYLHAAGVAHHDIKCENVLIGADGHVRICDFGVAERFADNDDGKCRVYYGTPAFQPPEVVGNTDGSSFDGCAADIWSAGVILYRLLCGGRLPFVGKTVFLVMQAIATEEPVLPECRADPAMRNLMAAMLSRDPAKRPNAAQALLHPAIARSCRA